MAFGSLRVGVHASLSAAHGRNGVSFDRVAGRRSSRSLAFTRRLGVLSRNYFAGLEQCNAGARDQ